MARIVPDLRAVARAGAVTGLTLSYWSAFEIERALRPGANEAIAYKWTCRYGRAAMRLYGLTLVGRGLHLERGHPYPARAGTGTGRVFVLNHRSTLDVFVGLAGVEASLVSRADVAGWPVVGRLAQRIGTLFVDRGDRQSGAALVRAMVRALEAGRGILVFPEGTTFAGDEVRPFRAGAFRAAAAARAEVVPLGLAYDSDAVAFLDESFFGHVRRVGGRAKTRVALVAGEPMGVDPGDLEGARERARERVQVLVRKARSLLDSRAGLA